ncbi:hypothetical protein DFH28DRAFT_1094831 [Melampsora americana]|nr:hypothetical protein DFH28DRAFT_1094831 [Melampsora americana]
MSEYVAYLAVANSKGIVYLTRVSREFQSIDSIQINSRSLYHDPTNQSTITAMQWSESPHQPESLALVFTRLGEIILCQISTSGILSSTVSCELPRPDPRLDWAGITNWAPCTGLSTIPILEQTSIIITLFNGLVYVFDYNHTNHHFVCDRFRSFQLSSDLRFRFRKLVGSAVTKQEVMSVYGSGCDPADELMELLETPKPCYQIAPLKSLLPALFSLEIPNQRLLELLEVDHYLDPKRDDSIGLENKSIQHDLFQNRLMDGLRIKLNLCRFLIDRFQLNLTIHSSDLNDEISGQIVDCYVKIKRRIYCEVIRMIDRFLEGLNPDSLSEFETKMKRRYRLASLVIGNRPEPTLVQLLAPEVPSHRLLDSDRLEGMSLEGEGGMMMMEEECPACERGIGFENLSLGVCERGHVWDRCLISFEVLNDCQLRICEGCDRKVKVRLGDRIEGLVKDRGCLYCGNRWKMN